MQIHGKRSVRQVLQELWADEGGAIIAADLVLTMTLLFAGSIIGVFIIRNCVLIVFMGVAVDMASEQTYDFDVTVAAGGTEETDRTTDDDADGFRGYDIMTTPANFDTIYTNNGSATDLGTEPDVLDNSDDKLGSGG